MVYAMQVAGLVIIGENKAVSVNCQLKKAPLGELFRLSFILYHDPACKVGYHKITAEDKQHYAACEQS